MAYGHELFTLILHGTPATDLPRVPNGRQPALDGSGNCFTMFPMGIRRSRRTGKKLAVRAPILGPAELRKSYPDRLQEKSDPNQPFTVQMEWNEVRETAARLYGRGFKRSQIARALMDHLYPVDGKARTVEQKLTSCNHKLRRWEYSQEFRDLVYQYAVVDLDMSSPQILTGLAKRAKRGRVDAARLALELTGRHSKDQETGPVNVTVNLANVARPE